jgi:hypothetical protein
MQGQDFSKMAWQGEVVKTIVFPKGEVPAADRVWEIATAGSTPDTVQRRVGGAGGIVPGMSMAAGSWDGYQLTIAVQPGRIEAGLTSLDPDPTGPTPLPMMADVPAALSAIRTVEGRILVDHATLRLGAIAQLVEQVDTPSAAIARLNTNIGHDLFPATAKDCLLQLNLRTSYAGGEVNRLCKWGAMTLTPAFIVVDATGVQNRTDPLGQREVAFLHLDVNNVPVDEPMSRSQAATLSEFFWSQVSELMSHGRRALS